jgi:hypothetical protein
VGSAEVPPRSPEVRPLGTPPADVPLVAEQGSADTTLTVVQGDAPPADVTHTVVQASAPPAGMEMAMVLFGAEPTGPSGSPVAAAASSSVPEGSSPHDEGTSLKREVFPELEEVVPAGPRWSHPAEDTLEDLYRPGIASSLYVYTSVCYQHYL